MYLMFAPATIALVLIGSMHLYEQFGTIQWRTAGSDNNARQTA